MKDDKVTGERMTAIFMFGAVLFAPPLLLLFASHRIVLGLPLLFLYLFLAWAALIALLALVVERLRGPSDSDTQATDRND